MNSVKNKYILSLLLTLMFMLSFAISAPATELSPGAEEPETLTGSGPFIAVILPLSGPFAEYGESLKKGYELGFSAGAETNEVLTPQYRVKYLDSKANPETARSLINLLSSEGEVAIATGTPLNATAWTASRACEKNHLPYLIVGADQDNLISRETVSSFRLTPKHSDLKQMLTGFIASRDPEVKSMGIIYDNSVCAIKKARELRTLCAEKSIDLSIWKQWQTLSGNRDNFYDLLNVVKERQPEILFLITRPELTNRLWQQGLRLEIMPAATIAIPTGANRPIIADATRQNPPANQLIYATPWLNPDNGTNDAENISPADNPLSAAGAAAAQVIMNCLENSLSLTAEEIIKSLETKKLKTIYGPVNFTAEPSGHQNPAIWYLCRHQENGPTEIIFPEKK